MDNTVLRIEDLKTYFYTEEGEIPAVDGVTVSLQRGKVPALWAKAAAARA